MSVTSKDFTDLIASINPGYEKTITKLVAENLINSYSAFYRKHHNLNHISLGLDLLKEVKDLCDNYLSVVYAWWFHDFISTPNSPFNELASTESAKYCALLLGLEVNFSKRIARLIMSTKYDKHRDFESNDKKIIHDVDLAILGLDPEIYVTYAKNIRAEYSVYTLKEYNEERILVLKSFLDLDFIFYTKYFWERFEDRARKNLATEINVLEKEISLK